MHVYRIYENSDGLRRKRGKQGKTMEMGGKEGNVPKIETPSSP